MDAAENAERINALAQFRELVHDRLMDYSAMLEKRHAKGWWVEQSSEYEIVEDSYEETVKETVERF